MSVGEWEDRCRKVHALLRAKTFYDAEPEYRAIVAPLTPERWKRFTPAEQGRILAVNERLYAELIA